MKVFNIVGIYEARIVAEDLDEALKEMMTKQLDQLDNVYVSDYDCEE